MDDKKPTLSAEEISGTDVDRRSALPGSTLLLGAGGLAVLTACFSDWCDSDVGDPAYYNSDPYDPVYGDSDVGDGCDSD